MANKHGKLYVRPPRWLTRCVSQRQRSFVAEILIREIIVDEIHWTAADHRPVGYPSALPISNKKINIKDSR
eukprot:scaffold1037_cov157-Amphora_coffeaeformis.AAC.5